MGTASSITKQVPVAKEPREFPTEWTWYAEDQPENKTEQSSRKTLYPVKEAALRMVMDAAKEQK
jgi:hypothetical protein